MYLHQFAKLPVYLYCNELVHSMHSLQYWCTVTKVQCIYELYHYYTPIWPAWWECTASFKCKKAKEGCCVWLIQWCEGEGKLGFHTNWERMCFLCYISMHQHWIMYNNKNGFSSLTSCTVRLTTHCMHTITWNCTVWFIFWMVNPPNWWKCIHSASGLCVLDS